jgi:hypothetical protein
MKPVAYTFFVASNRKGTVRKVVLPFYALHLLAILAVVGGITVIAAATSYTRMLWKVGNYNTLRRQQDTLKHNYEQLQSSVQDTNQRLNSLQSLATEVAMTYGFMRFRQSPFVLDTASAGSNAGFDQSMAQFDFLEKNLTSAALPTGGLRLLAVPGLSDLTATPTLWPVIGHLTGTFGERMDPFSGGHLLDVWRRGPSRSRRRGDRSGHSSGLRTPRGRRSRLRSHNLLRPPFHF